MLKADYNKLKIGKAFVAGSNKDTEEAKKIIDKLNLPFVYNRIG